MILILQIKEMLKEIYLLKFTQQVNVIISFKAYSFESESESQSVMSNSFQPHGLSMEFSRPEYWSGQPFPSPGDLLNPGLKPRSPALQADSLPAKPQGGPKNTRVGSLSLLQGMFLIQESNQGLLHCKHILYQLSYEETLQCFYFFCGIIVHTTNILYLQSR